MFDFHNTLVVIDRFQPPMWQTLIELGYPCTEQIELLFNSDGHNGRLTPRGSRYRGWREDQIGLLAKFVGVSCRDHSSVVERLLRQDQSWTVKAAFGAVSTIDGLRDQGIAVAICSNWDYDLQKYLIQAGLPSDLPWVTSAQLGVRKPHPLILELACRHFGWLPGRTIYVGDNWSIDMACALRAGLVPCWVTPNPEEALGYIPAIRSIDELLGHIYH